MAYSAPTTITTGQLVTASLMNTDWGGNISFLANPPACRATKTATQAITTATATAITFDTETFDTNTMHSTVTNTSRVTFTTAGLYSVTGFSTWALDAAGTYRYAAIRLNGATILGAVTQSAATLSANTGYEATPTVLYKATAADYVELIVQHDKGSNLNVSAVCLLAAVWVGLG